MFRGWMIAAIDRGNDGGGVTLPRENEKAPHPLRRLQLAQLLTILGRVLHQDTSSGKEHSHAGSSTHDGITRAIYVLRHFVAYLRITMAMVAYGAAYKNENHIYLEGVV